MMRFVSFSGCMAAASLFLSACSNATGGACSGIDLTVEPYGLQTNVWLYVKNASNEPKLVKLSVLDKDGAEIDSRTVSAPAKGLGKDTTGTYLPGGGNVVVKSCR